MYPAASYANNVKYNGGKVAIFNIDSTEVEEDADFIFRGPCEETLPKALVLTPSSN